MFCIHSRKEYAMKTVLWEGRQDPAHSPLLVLVEIGTMTRSVDTVTMESEDL